MSVFIFNSILEDGIMLAKKKMFPNLNQDEIDLICRINQTKFLNKYNLDYSNLVLIDQKDTTNTHDINHNYEDGKCIVLHNPTKELQYTDMIMIDKDSNIILGEMSGDCPIMVAHTDNLLILSHVGGPYIDRLLPKMVIERLLKENINPNDIKVFIGPFIHKESYIYNNYPLWTKSYVWKDAIEKKEDGYHIDMQKAIEVQLLELGILKDNMKFSDIDTFTDPNYPSHSAYMKGNKDKFGRFMLCATFKKDI